MEENKTQDQNSTAQSTPRVVENKASNNILLAAISYIGPAVIISYIFGREKPFVKFHVRQGLVLFSIEIILWILSSMVMSSFWMFINIINLGTFILSIIGIINALQGQQKELPLVGRFSSYFKI